MTTQKKLTLYQKLHKIQCEVIGLGKNKKGHGYEYVTGSKVLEYIKPLMNDYGILLKQEVLSIDNQKIDYKTGIGTQYEKDKSEILSKVMMRFTWVDVDSGDEDINLFGANGQNDWDKGVGSALTYAERYFLLKFFHINTDEDDIDNPDRKTSEEPKNTQRPTPPNPPQNTANNDAAKPLPILSKMTADKKDMTKEWIRVTTAISKGTLPSITEVKKYFTLTKEIEDELTSNFNIKP